MRKHESMHKEGLVRCPSVIGECGQLATGASSLEVHQFEALRSMGNVFSGIKSQPQVNPTKDKTQKFQIFLLACKFILLLHETFPSHFLS